MDVDPQAQQQQPPQQQQQVTSPDGGTPAAAAALMDFAGAPAATFPAAAAPAAISDAATPPPPPPAVAALAPEAVVVNAPAPVEPMQQDVSSLAHLLATEASPAPSAPAVELSAPAPPPPAPAALEQQQPSPISTPVPAPPASAPTPPLPPHSAVPVTGSASPLPPPPAEVAPSHPLAPPPQPFADASPTVAGTAFDAPASSLAPPPLPAVNGGSPSPSLKRDTPDDGPVPGGALGDLLNGPSSAAAPAEDEHAAKRAKLEEPTSLAAAPPPAPAAPAFVPAPVPAPASVPQPQAASASPLPPPPPAAIDTPAPAPPAPAPAPVPQQPYPVEPYGAGGLPSQYSLNPSPSPAPVAAPPPPPPPQQPAYQPQPWEAPAPGYQQPQQQQHAPPPPPAGQPTQQQPQGYALPQQAPQYAAYPPRPYPSPAPGQQQASSSGFATPAGQVNGHGSQSLPLSHAQQKFFLNLCRQIKKLPSAYAFSAPVDAVALGIPHYYQIITHPMDLSTIEAKLQASGPKGKGKKGGVGRYLVKEEVVEDFRRVWGNSDRFNGPEHAVSVAGRALEDLFERSLPGLPADEEPKPPTPKPVPSFPAYPPSGPGGARRESGDARPKREVHAPLAKDQFISAADPNRRKSGAGGPLLPGGKKSKYDEQFRHLRREIDACFKGKGSEMCWPFLAPVDPVALGIPEYPTIVKRPMDLSTVRTNLAEGAYDEPIEVNQDVKLMLRNCFAFNPPGTAVYLAGKQVEEYWQGRWKAMPPLPAKEESESEAEDEADSAEEEIATITAEMAALQKRLDAARARKGTKPKKKVKKSSAPSAAPGGSGSGGAAGPSKPKQPKQPKASTSGGSSNPKPKKQSNPNAPPKKPKAAGKKRDDDGNSQAEVTMAQKQELAEKIQHAEGDVLHKAIGIIQDSMPGENNGEEIELDIDALPEAVILKLFNLVVRGPRKKNLAASKSARGGTGGLNRKSMDEDEESAKIQALEAKMRAFESGQAQQQQPADDDEDSGSDSASEESE